MLRFVATLRFLVNIDMMSIQPAQRVKNIEEYYLQRKMKQVAQLNAKGADIVSLGVGGPDLMPPQSAITALQQIVAMPDVHSYSVTSGLPELRKAYADWYKRYYNVLLDPATQVLPLIGSKEGIMHISMTFLNPGDAVLVPNPGYPTYTSVSKLIGATVIPYDLKEEYGWLPDFEALEQLPLEKVKLMWINYPHMPTCTQPSSDVFEKAVAFAKRHGIVVVNDNPYSFILTQERRSILQVPGAMDVAIEMNSLSKSHNMAGWRMGMIASNDRFISWILKVKSNVDSGQFIPAMKAAATALTSEGDEWFKELNEEYCRRRAVAEKIMDALGVQWNPEQRGLYLWGRIPADAVSSEAFADKVLDKCRVFITPGFIFGSNGEGYIRISLCADTERLDEALSRIKTNL